jgi:hypothetical protein
MRPVPVTIRVDQRKIAEIVSLLEKMPRGMPKVVSSSINDALGQAKTSVSRLVGEEIALKKARIKEALTIVKSTPSTLAGKVNIRRKAVRLLDYGASQTKKGITVRVRSGGRELIKGAFFAVTKKGKFGVYRRAKPGTTHRVDRISTRGPVPMIYTSEIPIFEKYGPTVVGVVTGAPRIIEQVLKETQPIVYRRLASKVKALLETGNADASELPPKD